MTDTASTTPTANDPLDAALAYARLGLRVAPIAPGEKYPKGLIGWEDAASTDPDTIRSWWTGLYRGHGVCIAFDQIPDGRWVFAVDIDGESHGADGHAIWADLVDGYTGPPDTVEAITGGGGRHLIFTAPEEIRSGHLRDVDKKAIQIKGHGGQCVVEPTIHPDTGVRYTWVDGAAPWERRIAEAPDWLLALIQTDEPAPRPERPPAKDAGDRPGDHFAAAVDWADILGPDGWVLHHTDRTGERYWTRPGKDRREGASATTDHKGSDSLKMFTSSMSHVGLNAEETYSKLGYVAATRFDGNHSAAASALRADGYHSVAPALADLISDRPLPPEPDPVADRPSVTPETPPPPAPDAAWPTPTPLPQRMAPARWPDDILPPWVDDHARAAAKSIDTDVDVTAMLALGALSIAIFGHIRVDNGAGFTQDTNLYLVVALPPTEGKSPAHEQMLDCLREWETDRMTMRARARAEAEAHVDILKDQAADAIKTASKTGSNEDRVAAEVARAEIATYKMPPTGQVFVGRTTPERLAELLSETGERIAVASDEGGVLNVDAYNDPKRAPNLDLWLQAWSGRPHQPESRSGLRARLAHPLICLVVTTQPEDWDRIMGDPNLRSHGFPQRIMASVPTARAGTRNKDPRLRRHDQAAAAIYAGQLTELARSCDSWQHPAIITISDEAMDHWVDWSNALERRIGLDLADEAGWVGKMTDQAVLRLAAILHVAWGHDTRHDIDVATMARATRVGDYWLAHRLAATVDLDLVRHAKRLLGWILRRGEGTFTRAELSKHGLKGLRSLAETSEPLAVLYSNGWVRPSGEGLGVVDGAEALARGAVKWVVNPGAWEATGEPRDGADEVAPETSGTRPATVRNVRLTSTESGGVVESTTESQPSTDVPDVPLKGGFSHTSLSPSPSSPDPLPERPSTTAEPDPGADPADAPTDPPADPAPGVAPGTPDPEPEIDALEPPTNLGPDPEPDPGADSWILDAIRGDP